MRVVARLAKNRRPLEGCECHIDFYVPDAEVKELLPANFAVAVATGCSPESQSGNAESATGPANSVVTFAVVPAKLKQAIPKQLSCRRSIIR
jgi:hypothetical protein